MATRTNSASVKNGNGLGPRTFIFAVTTGTITTAAAITKATEEYSLTVVGVDEFDQTTAYIAAQGGNLHHTDGDGLESESGVALTATFEQ